MVALDADVKNSTFTDKFGIAVEVIPVGSGKALKRALREPFWDGREWT